MADMIYCTGEACMLGAHCARATRKPDTIKKPYEVFREAPHKDGYQCDYFWPEIVPGVTTKDTSQVEVVQMGYGVDEPDLPKPEAGPDFDLFSNVVGSGEPREKPEMPEVISMPSAYGTVEGDVLVGDPEIKPALYGQACLWPDPTQQEEVFQSLMRIHDDLIKFRVHCTKVRETKPEAVWLVLEPIEGRLEKILFAQGGDHG